MNKKIFILLSMVFIATGSVLYWYVSLAKSPEWQYNQVVNYYSDLYTKDVKGGSTPEETLELFITALEKGDIDDALLYIDPEQRARYEADMRAGKANGNLQLAIDDYKRINGGEASTSNRYKLYSRDAATGSLLTYTLFFNDLAGIGMFESI
ncbi:MAG: hypothetical protein Q8Q18_02095 [bacterium]|nr:hypothetical protein [bacterium]